MIIPAAGFLSPQTEVSPASSTASSTKLGKSPIPKFLRNSFTRLFKKNDDEADASNAVTDQIVSPSSSSALSSLAFKKSATFQVRSDYFHWK